MAERRKRIHRVDDGGCGGKLRTLFVFGNNPVGVKRWQSVGQVCTGCRRVKLDRELTIA